MPHFRPRPVSASGCTGAALATFSGRSIGVLYQFYRLIREPSGSAFPPPVRLNPRVHVAPDPCFSNRYLQFVIANASWIGLVRIVSLFGRPRWLPIPSPSVSSFLSILPSWGLSNAAATLVGQNLGAGHPQRAEQAVWRTGLYNMLVLGLVGVVFIFTATPLVRLFTHDPAVVPLAASALRILSYGNIAYAYGMVMLQSFNGAGDTVTPTIVNFFGFWVLEIPLAWWLALHQGLHSTGVYLSIVIAQAAVAIASILLFRRGKWKLQLI